jgi:hypothetical protein
LKIGDKVIAFDAAGDVIHQTIQQYWEQLQSQGEWLAVPIRTSCKKKQRRSAAGMEKDVQQQVKEDGYGDVCHAWFGVYAAVNSTLLLFQQPNSCADPGADSCGDPGADSCCTDPGADSCTNTDTCPNSCTNTDTCPNS